MLDTLDKMNKILLIIILIFADMGSKVSSLPLAFASVCRHFPLFLWFICSCTYRVDGFLPSQVQPDAFHVLQHRLRLHVRQPYSDQLLAGNERIDSNDSCR